MGWALEKRGAVLLTLTTAFLWGTSFPAVTLGLKSGLNPISFVFFRFGIASIPMLLFAIARKKNIVEVVKNKYCIILGLINTFSFILQFEGQVYVSASLSALIVNLSALFAATGSAIFLKEKFGITKITAVLIALAGVFLLTTKGSLSMDFNEALGVILLGLTAVGWAAYVVIDKRMLERMEVDALSMTTWIVILTSFFTAPLLLVYGYTEPSNQLSWSSILYTALLNTALPYTIYQVGLERLTATISSIILLVEPVVAMFVSSILLAERMEMIQLFGATMILFSIFLVSLSKDRDVKI